MKERKKNTDMDERSDQEDQTCGEWNGEQILENL